jgi:hypothetical protein
MRDFETATERLRSEPRGWADPAGRFRLVTSSVGGYIQVVTRR